MVVLVFSALRVSALHDRSLAIFIVILALNLSPVATNLVRPTHMFPPRVSAFTSFLQFRVVRSAYVQDPDDNLCFQIADISDSLVRK